MLEWGSAWSAWLFSLEGCNSKVEQVSIENLFSFFKRLNIFDETETKEFLENKVFDVRWLKEQYCLEWNKVE